MAAKYAVAGTLQTRDGTPMFYATGIMTQGIITQVGKCDKDTADNAMRFSKSLVFAPKLVSS